MQRPPFSASNSPRLSVKRAASRSAKFAAWASAMLVTASVSLAVPMPASAETVRQASWYLDALKVPQAQTITRGAGVVVAVIDSGVYSEAPDLAGNVLVGTGFGAGNGADGRDDFDGHGTSMASLIAAKGGGPTHALGLAPAAKILPIVVQATKNIDSTAVAPAIRWAADHGAKVINCSFSITPAAIPETADAVRYALSKNAVVVASVGNHDQGDQQPTPPSTIPGVVAVSSTGKNGQFFSNSVSGSTVVISAPGESIVSAGSTEASGGSDSGKYLVGSGTSTSAAIVSGAIALIRSKYPSLNAANIINRLIRTADDLGPPGRDPQYGFGRINLIKALTANVPSVSSNPLGNPAVQATPSAEPTGPSRRTAGPLVPAPAGIPLGWWITGSCCLIVIVVVIAILLLIMSSRRRKRNRTSPPTGEPYGGSPSAYQSGTSGYSSASEPNSGPASPRRSGLENRDDS
jgi:type VII secretion-associated serine protease mycosin